MTSVCPFQEKRIVNMAIVTLPIQVMILVSLVRLLFYAVRKRRQDNISKEKAAPPREVELEASNSCLQSGHTNHAFLLLPADTSPGVYVFFALHIAKILGHLVAKSLMPEMTFLELMVLAFIVNSLSPRIFEACDK